MKQEATTNSKIELTEKENEKREALLDFIEDCESREGGRYRLPYYCERRSEDLRAEDLHPEDLKSPADRGTHTVHLSLIGMHNACRFYVAGRAIEALTSDKDKQRAYRKKLGCIGQDTDIPLQITQVLDSLATEVAKEAYNHPTLYAEEREKLLCMKFKPLRVWKLSRGRWVCKPTFDW